MFVLFSSHIIIFCFCKLIKEIEIKIELFSNCN